MREAIALQVGADLFEGWERVSIQRSLMALSGSFEVSLADPLASRDWSFGALQNCIVTVGGARFLTGFIDAVDIQLGATEHAVTVQGRDKTADLVDCAAVKDRQATPHPGTLLKKDLRGLAAALAEPFGIEVEKGPVVGAPFRRFALERGETVFEALDRACKLRGTVPMTDPYGRLRLVTTGAQRAVDTLRYRVNVKAAKAAYNFQNRFSHYRLETQVASEGGATEALWGRATAVAATFRDTEVAAVRFRPTILSADADSTLAAAKARVASEALYRAANSESYEVTVAGWRQSDGRTFWAPNQVVKVEIPALYLDGEMLLVQVAYQQSREEGTTAALTLMRKDAFDTGRALEAQQVPKPEKKNPLWKMEVPKVPEVK